MRLLVSAFLATAPMFACSCLNTASACSAMSGSTVVFLGRVLVDSGEGWGTGPARVLVEEALLNVPKDLHEVQISTSAGTSCYYRLKAGERYVVFAQKQGGPEMRLAVGGCSNTFLLQGNDHVLRRTAQQVACRASATGGDRATKQRRLRKEWCRSRRYHHSPFSNRSI
jgi:hypothetical protein